MFSSIMGKKKASGSIVEAIDNNTEEVKHVAKEIEKSKKPSSLAKGLASLADDDKPSQESCPPQEPLDAHTITIQLPQGVDVDTVNKVSVESKLGAMVNPKVKEQKNTDEPKEKKESKEGGKNLRLSKKHRRFRLRKRSRKLQKKK
jgi:hypothetical protein